MRVRGNVVPLPMTIEAYHPVLGFVEVRLRENIKTVFVIDEITEAKITMYEYDEYVFHLKDKEDLQEEIKDNMDEWLDTGRAMEVNENASDVRDMKEALGILLGEVT